MKKKALWQAVKYALFSISAGVIQAISFALLYEVILHSQESMYAVSHIVALILSILWNFTLNRKYTFQSANNIPLAMLKVAGFYVVFTPASAYLGQLAVNSGWHGFLVEGLTLAANFVLEFLYFKYVVFRDTKNTRA